MKTAGHQQDRRHGDNWKTRHEARALRDRKLEHSKTTTRQEVGRQRDNKTRGMETTGQQDERYEDNGTTTRQRHEDNGTTTIPEA